MSFVTAHPDFARLFRAFDPAVHPSLYTSWHGNVVRQSAPRWMSRPYRLTGAGSVLAGGRWNVKGLMPVIYASTDPATLAAELHYKGLRYGWRPADFFTQLQVGMHWELQAVLDLTAPETRKVLRVTRQDMEECDWAGDQANGREPLTQALARAAFEHLAEGLIVPSARRKDGVNIVYFPSHRRAGTIIETLDEANIPFRHGL